MSQSNQTPSPQVPDRTPEILGHAQRIVDGLSLLTREEASLAIDLATCLLAGRRLHEVAVGLATLRQQWASQDGRTLPERAEQETVTTLPAA